MENDGVAVRRRPAGGTGLVGLRERLREAGGTLHGEDLPDGRYRLTVEVPIEVGATP
jgi:two-component system sensor histidine kinase DesK